MDNVIILTAAPDSGLIVNFQLNLNAIKLLDINGQTPFIHATRH